MTTEQRPIRVRGQKNIDKALYILSFAILGIAAFFLLWFLVSLFVPKTHLTFGDVEVNGVTEEQQTHLDHKHIERGSEIDFRIEICKLTDFPVTVGVSLFDGGKDTIVLKSIKTYALAGCTHLVASALVPVKSPLGEYSFRITAYQEINHIRAIREQTVLSGYEIVEVGHQ